jgi:hypothetical protein
MRIDGYLEEGGPDRPLHMAACAERSVPHYSRVCAGGEVRRGGLRSCATARLAIPIHINRAFAQAEVKVAIGGVCPHDEAGFSGGAKILLGVFGLKTLSRFHRLFSPLARGSAVETDFRHDMEAIADLVGLDYSINVVMNQEREIAGVFGGDVRAAFREAAVFVAREFGVKPSRSADAVIANAYPLDTSWSVLGKSTWPFRFADAAACRIVVSALAARPRRRVRRAASDSERLLHDLKGWLLLRALKRGLRHLRASWHLSRNPALAWRRPYVLFVPHVAADVRSRPRLWHGNRIWYSWELLMRDMAERLPTGRAPKVAIYTAAPLLYPASNDS